MKLRFSKNSVRLRLSKGEIDYLSKNGNIYEHIQFGPSTEQLFTYCIEQVDSQKYSFSINEKRATVFMPKTECVEWCNSDTIVGKDATLDFETGSFYILLEKDFQCLTPRKNEDESDNFENPNKSC
ncbi:MAG: hypothetical protein WAS56_10030 [Saprospiraceae bacterium]|jgi:hypothetical protein|nr:hypothetical protein [Saprospiraceae bacterium]MBK9995383.1 hypothetical protein [Saprospiraceae bacterium]